MKKKVVLSDKAQGKLLKRPSKMGDRKIGAGSNGGSGRGRKERYVCNWKNK